MVCKCGAEMSPHIPTIVTLCLGMFPITGTHVLDPHVFCAGTYLRIWTRAFTMRTRTRK